MFIRPEIDDYLLSDICKALGTTMTRLQGDAVRFIAEYTDAYEIKDINQVAYIIATCYHESNFLPIKERRARSGTAVRAMQDKYWYTGYYGRGYPQLTWENNYRKFSKITGKDLVKNPDLMLQPETGAQVLVIGMNDGLFTGKKLGDYFTDKLTDPVEARRIVNGTFQADKVALAYLKILPVLQKRFF